MSVIGLDVGTTGCKAIVFDAEGRVLGQASREYEIRTPRPNWAEQDPEGVWRKSMDAVREAVAHVDGDWPAAMALSVQGEAVTPVDASGRPLRPTILGMDTRTGVENEWLAERFGAEALFQRTGMPMHTVNTLPKLLWLQRHEPRVWAEADQFLLYEDFFLRRLTGEAVISHCLASRTQMYDLRTGGWAEDVLVGCEIDPERLARLAPAEGGVVGTLRPDLAQDLGLLEGVALVSGGHDQACAALGCGVVEEGMAMDSTGTAEVVEVAMGEGVLSDALRRADISVYRHVVPGMTVAMTLNHSGGLVLRWFRDTLCRWELERVCETGQDPYDLILADAPEGPTDLFVLPHFSGKGTPGFDNRSKGAVLGLTFSTDRASLAKAILEGLTFELRSNVDFLQEAGIPIDELRAVGGAARSGLWLQLKADLCKVPLRVPEVTESACLGAAILASVGGGAHSSLDAAVQSMVRVEERVEPRAEIAGAYDERYELYRRIYPTLSPLHRAMG